jgi:hypothetical protein
MSSLARAAQPSPTSSTSENAPAALAPARKFQGRIYTSLPKMWIGMIIASTCLLFQLVQADMIVFMLSVVGTCYWLFCIHRIHTVLDEYTLAAYPISPRRAIGFYLIPVFEYYWVFYWTRAITKFIDTARWPLFGLVGGLAIDRRWGKGKAPTVAITLLTAAASYEVLLCLLRMQKLSLEMLAHLSVALGWGLALVVCSASSTLAQHEAVEV